MKNVLLAFCSLGRILTFPYPDGAKKQKFQLPNTVLGVPTLRRSVVLLANRLTGRQSSVDRDDMIVLHG